MRLDRLITIEQRQVTRDASFGSQQVTWVKFLDIYAELEFSNGTEKPISTSGNNKQQVAYQPVNFKTRYITGLDKTMRILFEGEYYEITAIQEIQRRQWIRITAEQRDNLP